MRRNEDEMDNQKLADLLFPEVVNTPEYYEEKFPYRKLPNKAEVTRMAPSPTGFIHLGNLYSALADERIAHRNGGVFYLRIEDTDEKRKVDGAVETIINVLRYFDIEFEARAAGGLKIIGTERHESRRIDNQLRGRAGRQGDPGESRFYISLEDNLMRLFAQETLMNTFNRLGVGENDQIEHKLLSNAIETAQKKIETNNYGIRLHLLEYDQVMNEQREIMYAERKRVLNGESMRNSIMKMITDFVEGVVNRSVSEDKSADEWNYDEINELLLPTIPIAPVAYDENIKNKNELIHALKEKAVKFYEDKEALFPEPETIREIERVVLLKVIDRKWMDHIDDMDQLKQGIGLQAYGQKDPVVQYKMMGYDMFDEMTRAITEDTVRLLMHIQVEEKVEREQVAKVTGTNKDEGPSVKGPVRRTDKKIYPNDLCPCGSGKKYKNCCGRQA